MNATEKFRRQHEELLKIATEISGYLSTASIQENAAKVRTLLSTLSGKITVHLVGEDEVLYPRLLTHESIEIKKLAQQYIDEMGSIKAVFSEYSKKWYNPSDIQTKAEDFIKETKAIFEALGKRIEKENNELYKLIDEFEQIK